MELDAKSEWQEAYEDGPDRSSRSPARCRDSSTIWTRWKGVPLDTSGTTFRRSIRKRRSASAIRRRSRSRFLIASSRPAATRTTSSSTPSAAAARRLSRRRISGASGSASTFRPTACRVMAKRLRDVCDLPEDEKLWTDRARLRRARPAVDGGEAAQASRRSSSRTGRSSPSAASRTRRRSATWASTAASYPVSAAPKRAAKAATGELGFMDDWYPDPGEAEGQGRPPGHRRLRGRDDARGPRRRASSSPSTTPATPSESPPSTQDRPHHQALTVQEILEDESAKPGPTTMHTYALTVHPLCMSSRQT